ncbi:MAG: hypothetical protein LRY54_03495 [Alphaproteobacteria bacterium]|nr:hypothetical protein [Alphaproteobacteria bacterium]MCD8563111.1 hypothetical protein [Alphaproteobacteria bacterium]
MPVFDLKEELKKAARQTIFGNIELASAPRGYMRANNAPNIADAALKRLGELSGQGPVSALHFKQAIVDFSTTQNAFHKAGNAHGATLAGAAHNALVEAYIEKTGDDDVYRALPREGTVLEM